MPGWDEHYAFERLREHKVTIEAAAGSNEATTRLRAIDTMLLDVLGWDKLDIDAELYCRAEGFADYALKDDASICMIIEAKRADETFVLPAREFPEAPVGFPLLAKECPAAETAPAGSRLRGLGRGEIHLDHQWISMDYHVDVCDKPEGDGTVGLCF